MASRNQDAAAASGGLGGYREAIMQSERQRNLGTQLGDIQTRGSQQAFQNAQAQLERERASQLGAAKFGLQQYTSEEQSRQQQERFAQGAYQASQQAQQQEAANQAKEKFAQSAYDMSSRTALAKAKGLIGLGTENERAALSRIQALLGIGSQERALQQASLDMGYDDFLRQQGYSKDQLGFFSNLLRGVPVAPQASTSTFTQQPGLFQQALGAGLSGLGLYKGYGGG